MTSKIQKYKNLLFLGLFTVFSIVAYFWFSETLYYAVFESWAQKHKLELFVALVALKTAGIIWPPIPGGLLTMGAIPILGWPVAYLADFLGATVGAIICYYLGRVLGYKFLRLIFDHAALEKISTFKVKKDKELEMVFVSRALGGYFMEMISYSSGLLKINFTKFVIGSSLAHAVIGIPAFYLVANFLKSDNYYIGLTSVFIFIIVMWKVKGRYFE